MGRHAPVEHEVVLVCGSVFGRDSLDVGGVVFWIEHQARGTFTLIEASNTKTWFEVHHHIDRGELDEAIRIGAELIEKAPLYPEGHKQLAWAYLAAGKTDKARDHYAQAFWLFPSKENEKLLKVIDKRIEAENPQP